jgi:hypothetical protein
MSRPQLEVADIIRSTGTDFIERNRSWLRWAHLKVLLAIARCRTDALGGHIDECTRCGHRATISYNSCRNRHCPKCQTGARERWIAARCRELLPTPYVHVVFTLPPQLASLALQNKKVVYGLLLRASAETLLEVARNPRHLGAEICTSGWRPVGWIRTLLGRLNGIDRGDQCGYFRLRVFHVSHLLSFAAFDFQLLAS